VIGKGIIDNRPVNLVEVEDIMQKRLADAEEERKRKKKDMIPKIVAPVPVVEGEEAAAPTEEVVPEEKPVLGLEQRNALEYAKKFAKIGKRKAPEMMEKLMGVDKMKPEIAVKLVDIMPENEDVIKLIFAKERVTANDSLVASVKKIIEEFKK